MRKFVWLVGLVMLWAGAAQAQNRFDLYAGYSYMRMDAVNQTPSLNGWEGSLLWKPSSFFGLGGEATGEYGILGPYPMNFHTYLFGAQVSLPKRISPFVHALAGVARLSSHGVVKHSFSAEVGGGADLKVTDALSLRLVDVDFITSSFTELSPEVHITAGIVIHF